MTAANFLSVFRVKVLLLCVAKQTVRNRRRLKDQVQKKGRREGGELQREGGIEESRKNWGKKSRKIQLHTAESLLDLEGSA